MLSRNEIRLVAFTEEGKENVEAACEAAKKNGFDLKSVWLSPEDASKVTKLSEDVVYIVDPFDGEEEEKVISYLVNLNYPVIGPRCAITALNQRVQLSIKMKFPLYTLTMHKSIICFSNIVTEEREKLIRLVELMGGKVSRELNGEVTHLIVGEVGSVKYFTAAKCGIKIMVKDWIHYLWKHGVSQSISAMKGEWDDYWCPVFLGCSVSSTGFNPTDKMSIQKMITKHSGEYTGTMKLDITTHLIANKPEGQKYNSAFKFGVKVVNINWLYDSIEKKSCQSNEEYVVKSEGMSKQAVKQSTPEKEFLKPKTKIVDVDVSCIGRSMVNETVQSTMNDTTMSSLNFSRRNDSYQVEANARHDAAAKLKQKLLSFPDRNYRNILDGVYVYLTGFSVAEGEKMRRLLSLSNAIIYNQLTASVSHVIVGQTTRSANSVKASVMSVHAQNPELQTVRYTWVLECLEASELVSEIEHWAEELLPAPNSGEETFGENSEIFSTTRTTLKKKSKSNDTAIDHRASILPFIEDNDMLSQYYDPHATTLTNTTAAIQDENETALPEVTTFSHVSEDEELNMDMSEKTGDKDPTGDNDITGILDVSDFQGENRVYDASHCFSRKTFFLFGFDGKDLEDKITAIKSRGGNVLPVNSKQVGDYAVVPLTGWVVNRTVQDVVTDFWLELCLSRNKLLPSYDNTMCTPISIPNNSNPLEGCVACLSKYQPPERTYLANLIRDLGGICQDSVARRKVRNLEPTTHLVISEPGGEKYSGCKSWGIYTVTEEWVYESARKGQKVTEDDFSVDKPRKNKAAPGIATNAVVKEPVRANCSSNVQLQPLQRLPNPLDKIRLRLKMKKEAEERAEEEAKKNVETPLAVRYKRMNLETPSKFMRKDRSPVSVTFDLTEVFKMLKTPVEQQAQIRESARINPETPMSEYITRFLDEAVANIPPHLIKNLERKLDDSTDEEDQMETSLDSDLKLEVTEDQTMTDIAQDVGQNNDPDGEERKLFEGLVICLGKKFHKKYPDLCKTVKLHGGEFRWTYDKAITHLLFEGRTNNKNKEILQAKNEGKIIVSPYWIQACVQTKCKIDEALFPPSYDPNNSLQVVTTTSPSKSRRRSLRSSASTSSGDSPVSDPKNNQLKSEKEVDIETEDSQETREKLRRKLEHVMSTANISRATHTHRLSCNSANISSPAAALAHRRTSAGNKPIEMKNLDSFRNEFSQDVQVSWDDPTGREELERLQRENQSGNDSSALGIPNCSTFSEWGKENSFNDTKYPDGHGTTEPTSVIDGLIPCFMFTSVEDRAKYVTIVSKLGGAYKEDALENNVTHLIVGRPSRNEKCLTALACGIWVLDSKYLDACEQAQKFLQEDEFEFGNPKNLETKTLGSAGFIDEFKMSCHRWRCILQKRRKELGVCVGAFHKWKLVLNIQPKMLKAFRSVLLRGSATILSERLPFDGSIDDLTHVFVDQRKKDPFNISDFEGLITKVHVCEINFIGDYLVKDPPPEPESFYPNELKVHLERTDEDGREVKRIRLE